MKTVNDLLASNQQLHPEFRRAFIHEAEQMSFNFREGYVFYPWTDPTNLRKH